jgi:hypothetical protein
MKKIRILIGVLLILVTSCNKESMNEDNTFKSLSTFSYQMFIGSNLKSGTVNFQDNVVCTSKTFDLTAGQNLKIGNIIVSNDQSYLYITYKTIEGWMLKEVHLYAGTLSGVPVNSMNIPVPGKFPIVENFTPEVEEVTFAIPLKCLPDCPYIVAHATVVNKNLVEETAWGGELTFSSVYKINRWGFVIGQFCVEKCDPKIVAALKTFLNNVNTNESLWAVSLGEGSENHNLGLGINYYNPLDINIYPVILFGNPLNQVGNISITDYLEGGIHFLQVDVNLNDNDLAFGPTYLYVGSSSGFEEYTYYQYDLEKRTRYWEFPFQQYQASSTRSFKIPFSSITE